MLLFPCTDCSALSVEQIQRCLGHELKYLFLKLSSSSLSAGSSIFMVKISTVTYECYFLNGILDALFNKLSILKVSGSEICKEKYRKYFLFVLKHMVLKLACVHF